MLLSNVEQEKIPLKKNLPVINAALTIGI